MRILFVEDDPTTARLLTQCGECGVREIAVAHSPEEAAGLLASRRWSAAVIDWVLGTADGVDVARAMRAGGDMTPVVLVTAAGDADFHSLRARAREVGRASVLRKPYTLDEVAAACRALGAVPAAAEGRAGP